MNAEEIEVKLAKIMLWLLVLCGLVFAVVSMLDAAPQPTIHWLNVVTGQAQWNMPGEMGVPIADAIAALGPVSQTCTSAQFHTHDARRYYCVVVGGAIKRPWVWNGPPPLTPCTFSIRWNAMNGYTCVPTPGIGSRHDSSGYHWRPLR